MIKIDDFTEPWSTQYIMKNNIDFKGEHIII